MKLKFFKDKRLELVDGPETHDFAVVGKLPRDELENKFKEEILDIASGLLQETGFGGMMKGKLYNVILDHIIKKIFSGKTLSEADEQDIEFTLHIMPEIRSNFKKSIIAGIISEK